MGLEEEEQRAEPTLAEYARWRFEMMKAAALILARLEREKAEAASGLSKPGLSLQERNELLDKSSDDRRIKMARARFDEAYRAGLQEFQFKHGYKDKLLEYTKDIIRRQGKIRDLNRRLDSFVGSNSAHRQLVYQLKQLEDEFVPNGWRLFAEAAGYGEVELGERIGVLQIDFSSRWPLQADPRELGHAGVGSNLVFCFRLR